MRVGMGLLFRLGLGFGLGLGLAAAQANAPDNSVRPLTRGGIAPVSAPVPVPVSVPASVAVPETPQVVRISASQLAPATSARPQLRKAAPAAAAVDLGQTRSVRLAALSVPAAPTIRPKQRPKVTLRKTAGGTTQAGLFKKKKKAKISAKGSVCGVNGIKGTQIAAIPGRIRGCGVASPVAVTSVSGVALTSTAKIDCGTAKALNSWVENAVKPAVGKLGGGVASLKVAAHYACRTRNNKKGAKISEHGKGRAIDISAINLNNGQSITVLKGWNRKVEGPILKRVHKGACGPFGTVLGPNADRYHQDHFHFDTARYRSGPYCR